MGGGGGTDGGWWMVVVLPFNNFSAFLGIFSSHVNTPSHSLERSMAPISTCLQSTLNSVHLHKKTLACSIYRISWKAELSNFTNLYKLCAV